MRDGDARHCKPCIGLGNPDSARENPSPAKDKANLRLAGAVVENDVLNCAAL